MTLVAGLVTVIAWGSAFVGTSPRWTVAGLIALGRLIVSAVALYGVLRLTIYSVPLNAAEQRVDAGTAAMTSPPARS